MLKLVVELTSSIPQMNLDIFPSISMICSLATRTKASLFLNSGVYALDKNLSFPEIGELSNGLKDLKSHDSLQALI